VAASEAVETTADVPSTSATTTSTTTTAPTTTNAPTTTIDPAEDLAAEVEADYREGWRLAIISLSDPDDEEAREEALAFRLGTNRDTFEDTVAQYKRDHLALREGVDVAAEIHLEQPARLVAGADDLAALVVCEIDPWLVVEVGGAPDGSDAVVDDALYSYRTEVFMRHRDGRWMIEGGNQIQSWTGLEECPE
jgi:hypothetical protein